MYTPLVKESDYISQESNSFLDRFFNGHLSAMVSSYLEQDQLSNAEIDTLRDLLSNSVKKGGDADA